MGAVAAAEGAVSMIEVVVANSKEVATDRGPTKASSCNYSYDNFFLFA